MQLDLDLTRFYDQLRTKEGQDGKRYVFDPVRQQWLVWQPEEMVRQLLIQYLIQEKGYNKNRISIEQGIQRIHRQRRCDILVYDVHMQPFLLVECKAPKIKIGAASFEQISIYNYRTTVPYLLVSNGPVSYCYAIDYEQQSFAFLPEVPDFG